MFKRLIFWLLFIACAGALHLFGNNFGTLVIFSASVIIPGLSGIILFATAKFLRLHPIFELPETCSKGAEFSGMLLIEHKNRIPAMRVSCLLMCENLFTGERVEKPFFFSAAGRRTVKIPFSLMPLHCGGLRISAMNFSIFDIFGLFSRRLNCCAETTLTVSANSFEMNLRLKENIESLADNDEYSMTRPGPDSGEIFGVHEYVPGDPIKSIHWKLTEKLDRVMVREFGLPVAKQVLLLLDARISENSPTTAEGWDTIAEVFTSLALSILRFGIRPTVGRQNDGVFISRELETEEEIAAAISEFLAVPPKKGAGVASCLRTSQVNFAADHIIVVSPDIPPDISVLQGGNRLIVLRYGEPATGGYSEAGVLCVPFSRDDYQTTLFGVVL